MKKYQLGEFEEIVMLTICILHPQAYGVSIQREIESRLSREASMGALHSALIRLEDKGFLKSKSGESSEGREGRPRRYYEVTAPGRRALEYVKQTREQLWSVVDKLVVKSKFASL